MSKQTATEFIGGVQLTKGSDIPTGSTIAIPDTGNYFNISGGPGTVNTITIKGAGTAIVLGCSLALITFTTAGNLRFPSPMTKCDLLAGSTILFVSDGTNWNLVGAPIRVDTSTNGVIVDGPFRAFYDSSASTFAEPAVVATPASAGRTITGAVTDGVAYSVQSSPKYTGAFTVTRHNYIQLDTPVVSGSTVTDACVMRFNAAAGTHKAVDGATTKLTPGGVDAWVKVNINGTIYFVPAFLSKTA